MGIVRMVLAFLRAPMVGRAELAAENVALRHDWRGSSDPSSTGIALLVSRGARMLAAISSCTPSVRLRIRLQAQDPQARSPVPTRYDLRQESYEVIPHVRLCAGGAGQPASLPRQSRSTHIGGQCHRGFAAAGLGGYGSFRIEGDGLCGDSQPLL